MAKKSNRLILLIVLVIAALALLNIYVFTSKPSPVYCYKDVCLIGKEDPLAETRALIANSSRSILVIEGDAEATQKSGYVSGALVLLSQSFGIREVQIVGIKFDQGQPVECICATNFGSENFTNCLSNTTSYCEGLSPGDDEIMLKVYYPDYPKDEIIVDGRTIKFQAKTGLDAFAMVQFFQQLFLK